MTNEADLIHTPPKNKEIIEVDIASAGRRIWAAILNTVFTLLALVPPAAVFIAAIPDKQMLTADIAKYIQTQEFMDSIQAVISISTIPFIIYTIVQIVMMSIYGQSLGKKIMRIKVLKTNGNHSGFWRTVILREIVFSIAVGIVAAIVSLLLVLIIGLDQATAEIIEGVINILSMLVCLIMLFNHAQNRRTLQDIMANTVVVQLPKKSSS